jgi:hypothetical protein
VVPVGRVDLGPVVPAALLALPGDGVHLWRKDDAELESITRITFEP